MKQTLVINGNEISYTYLGNDNDVLVILLHGFGVNQEEKGNYITLSQKLFNAGMDSLRFDFLGHGESEGDTRDLTIDEALKEVNTFVKKYPHQHLYLVGTSYGGGIAVLYAENNPVEKIVLWSPLIDYEHNIKEPQNHFCREFLGEEALKQIKEVGFAQFGVDGTKFDQRLFEDIEKYNPINALRNESIPIKIFHGKKDIIVPYKQSLSLQSISTNIKVELLEFGTHCFYDETSGEVITKTVSFLKNNHKLANNHYS